MYCTCTASAIYLAAQAELFATVVPGFPVWDLAGLIGSTLWLAWLIVVGVRVLGGGLDDSTTIALGSR